MNKAEYKQYEAAVKEFFFLEGIQNLSSGADRECNEPHFSWQRCDCCQRPLGGDREFATGFNPTTKEVREYEICMDCVYYAEYGRLDDATMQKVEQ